MVPAADIQLVSKSFMRHLRAENLSPNTVATYRTAVEQFGVFLAETGMPTTMTGVRREHIETWVAHMLRASAPATAANRYGGLRAFWKWAVDEGEVKSSPMEHMRPPKVPERLTPVLTVDQLNKLIAACRGADFESRRDMAILQVFISTGARKSEIGNLRYSAHADETDIDLDAGRALVRGKGGRDRLVDLTQRTVRALDRYLRMRDRHWAAGEPWLWVGKRGRLTPHGCARAMQKRAGLAGIGALHVRQIRHTFAHQWLADGGGEDALMRHLGWRSREMVSRYAAIAGQERALSINRRVGLGRRF